MLFLITVCEIDMRFMQMGYHFEGFKKRAFYWCKAILISTNNRPHYKASASVRALSDMRGLTDIRAFSELRQLTDFVCSNPRMLGGPSFCRHQRDLLKGG